MNTVSIVVLLNVLAAYPIYAQTAEHTDNSEGFWSKLGSAFSDNNATDDNTNTYDEELNSAGNTTNNTLGRSKPLFDVPVDRKTRIHKIQEYLTILGYEPGPIDGHMGKKTSSSIYVFQRDFGLPADGLPSREVFLSLAEQNEKVKKQRANVPSIEVALSNGLRSSQKLLYYECEKELNIERRSEGIPEIRIVSADKINSKTDNAQTSVVNEYTKEFINNATINLIAGYMAPTQGALLAQQLSAKRELLTPDNLTPQNQRTSQLTQSKEYAEKELQLCVRRKQARSVRY